MATITLRKSKFDGIQDVLDRLFSCFDDYDATLRELRSTAEGVDSSTCSLEDAIDEIASSSEDEDEKVEKLQKLNQKIEGFVNTAIQKEQAARDKIVEKKNDFYKQYSNLKPDCEKGFWERAGDVFCAIGSWIVEHLDIVIAAIIILAAIVVCIVCPAAIIAIIGVVVCVMSTIMGIADLVCMALTGGKDIATVLAENGHGLLAKIWKGVGIGLDVASIILPIGAGVKFAMEATGKTFKVLLKDAIVSGAKKCGSFFKHPIAALKAGGSSFVNGAKNMWTGFRTACKENGFMRTIGGKVFGGLKGMSGVDDLENGFRLAKTAASGGAVGEEALKILGMEAAENVVSEAGERAVREELAENVTGEAMENSVEHAARDSVSDNAAGSALRNMDSNPVTLSNDPKTAYGQILDIESAGLQDVADNKNFNSYSFLNYDYDADDMMNTVSSNLTVGDMYTKNGNIISRDSLNGKVRNIMHEDFLQAAQNNPAMANALRDLGIDVSNIPSRSALEDQLGAIGLTIHEDMAQHRMQVVPTFVNDMFAHDGDVSFMVNSLFDADSRTVGSVMRNVNDQAVNAATSSNAFRYFLKSPKQDSGYSKIVQNYEKFMNLMSSLPH